MINGKDLILYILNNNLENEPVFKDGKFLGFLNVTEFAKRRGVGEETVYLWVNLGYVDAMIVYDEVYIPYNAEVKIP